MKRVQFCARNSPAEHHYTESDWMFLFRERGQMVLRSNFSQRPTAVIAKQDSKVAMGHWRRQLCTHNVHEFTLIAWSQQDLSSMSAFQSQTGYPSKNGFVWIGPPKIPSLIINFSTVCWPFWIILESFNRCEHFLLKLNHSKSMYVIDEWRIFHSKLTTRG